MYCIFYLRIFCKSISHIFLQIEKLVDQDLGSNNDKKKAQKYEICRHVYQLEIYEFEY